MMMIDLKKQFEKQSTGVIEGMKWVFSNLKPNLSAQNTKYTILWSRIWRQQEKQTSDKWLKPHSRIAEFWRIFLKHFDHEN